MAANYNVRILLIAAFNRINFQFLALLMITLQVINVMSMENLTSYQIKHGGINVKSKCSTISCSGLGLLSNRAQLCTLFVQQNHLTRQIISSC